MDRAWLKRQAKAVIKKHYFILLIVSFVMAVTAGSLGSNGGDGNITLNMTGRIDDYGDWDQPEQFYRDETGSGGGADFIYREGMNVFERYVAGIPGGGVLLFLFKLGVGVFSFLFVIGSLVFIFLISFPLNVGGARIYLDCANGGHAPHIGRFSFAFRSGHYGNIWVAGFLRSLYTFLWGLLFIIPGIVKSYSYCMVPYILADDPEMRVSDAIRLSREMMRGHKMERFILDISFWGWYLLGALAFGIGTFLVHPYRDATVTQFYLQLRSGYLAGPEPAVGTAAGGYAKN